MLTDGSGAYRIGGLTEVVLLDVSKPGYIESGRSGIPTRDSVVNFTLNQKVSVVAGESITATIWGDDDLMWDDPIPLGCHAPTACKAVFVTTAQPATLTLRLRWDGASDLAVQLLTNSLMAEGPSAAGASPLEVSATEPAGENIVIVRFDKVGATRPSAGANQSFALDTSISR